MRDMKLETATLGGGCFWCTEAIYQRIKGIESVMPGYAGGKVENPTYDQVCSGSTGHAEAIQIKFDPMIISYEKLLQVFWGTHDPTTINRQGGDVGSQYRSVVFYHDKSQKETAEKLKQKLDTSGEFASSIVTEIVPFTNFYIAENYHQNYFNSHQDALYCQMVIGPKIKKIMDNYKTIIK